MNLKSAIFKALSVRMLRTFFDFEKWLDDAKLDKNKKVLMYCTGGIRCEKFSVLMEKKGFKDVNQLHGGIINYAQKENGAYFKGKCFVFDDRLAIPISEDQQPVSRCKIVIENDFRHNTYSP